ncbi:predicted protein [Naegleria gruberi]|uniref:Predicted protein n=1 Tax=Naegleria gruberi TaxID=5762 RepID=D2V0Q2_NAEGR|nr:uncharacterized protein NAEGRDRAFT_62375 [Naegleria gruberi]EFC49765.1 predicted protein [Naegleria gruberi]|eukprot:XP_002682509.1 predicted protein [Naegleria gruberi strain NEG-M]
MISYPFDTISLTHLRSKQVRLFKTPKVISQFLKGNSGNNEIEVIINNAMGKVKKVFEEMETLKNTNGLQGLYRGYFSGFLLESIVSMCSNLLIGNVFDLFWNIWKGNSNNSNYEFTKTIITFSLSHLIVAPFTFARMRYQSDYENEYSSFLDCVNRIYKKEGWRAFYRATFISLYIF